MSPSVLVTVPLPLTDTVRLKKFGFCVNVAVTDWACDMTTVQEPVPLHAPPQPVKLQPGACMALRVTGVPAGYEFAHVPGQLIPPSTLATVPLPLVNTVN